jgi:HSP20 family protein
MTLNRWDPLRDLLNFQEKVSRLVDSNAKEATAKREACWCPAVDVLETPETYLFRAELPGVGTENISIEVHGNHLRISGVRTLEPEPAIAAYHSIERVHGVFERNFALPGRVDADRATAKYEDGMLEIVLPKSDETHERRIAVVCLSR